MQYQKVKSVAKTINTKGRNLEKVILNTLGTCAEIVGATLGPGGMNVLIEKQESGLFPLVTKDGVTVFKNIGFSDSTAQVIMEAARDSSIRTASEAGDGTTTATILAYTFVREIALYCFKNPKVSPQKVARELEKAFKTLLAPKIREMSRRVAFDTEEGRKHLRAVAKVSANGDVDLADAVLNCFDLVGNEGNVTILEANGPSSYQVSKIDGYGVPIGYEECCGPYYQKFVNDPGTQTCQLDNPFFVPYFGRITDIGTAALLLEKIVNAANGKVINVILAATSFSETVLGQLATNFSAANKQISIFPLTVPLSQSKTAQYDFLCDMAALSGARVFDPIECPLDNAKIEELGSILKFESNRFRSNVMIKMDEATELRIFRRADELNEQLSKAVTSELDKQLIKERVGKLTGGIAKLIVTGSSSGELREKRDRAEDAICAVRGALNQGVLPGGGWTLLALIKELELSDNPIYNEVLATALLGPVEFLFKNSGFSREEFTETLKQLRLGIDKNQVYDLLDSKMVDAYESGLLDSTPAVLEAVKNSISIASLLGTCGGTIVFRRDSELERKESIDVSNFLKDANTETE